MRKSILFLSVVFTIGLICGCAEGYTKQAEDPFGKAQALEDSPSLTEVIFQDDMIIYDGSQQQFIDETIDNLELILSRILTSMENNDFEIIKGLIAKDSNARENMDSLQRMFTRWVEAESHVAFGGSPRSVYIVSLNIISPYDFSTHFINTMIAPSGKTFFAISDFDLSYSDGDWKISHMTNEFFNRSATVWLPLTDDIIEQISSLTQIKLN